jgi:hypothetical protein
MERLRKTEARLATFSLVALAIFAPVETVASWQMVGGARALIHPMYWHSLTGMVLLFVGAKHSLGAPPRRAPERLCASHAWWAATGWRATFGRVDAMSRGVGLHWGAPELWAAAGRYSHYARLLCPVSVT